LRALCDDRLTRIDAQAWRWQVQQHWQVDILDAWFDCVAEADVHNDGMRAPANAAVVRRREPPYSRSSRIAMQQSLERVARQQQFKRFAAGMR
jgi:hypothetical protein